MSKKGNMREEMESQEKGFYYNVNAQGERNSMTNDNRKQDYGS